MNPLRLLGQKLAAWVAKDGEPAPLAAPVLELGGVQKIVFVGDTGQDTPTRRAVLEQVQRERAGLVVALGDLVYPWGPRCASGLDADSAALLGRHLGELARLAPHVALLLGNHDTANPGLEGWRWPAREACFTDYARAHGLIFPDPALYGLDLGGASRLLARLVVVNTNALDQTLGQRAAQMLSEARTRGALTVLAGHHGPLATPQGHHDPHVAAWLAAHELQPDLFFHGHTHKLGLGLYNQTLIVNSGSVARVHAGACDLCDGGWAWIKDAPGYALLHLAPCPEECEVEFKIQGADF